MIMYSYELMSIKYSEKFFTLQVVIKMRYEFTRSDISINEAKNEVND